VRSHKVYIQYMWPDLQKPNTIALAKISGVEYSTCIYIMNFFWALYLYWRKCLIIIPGYHLICLPRGVRKSLFISRICESWAFVYETSKWLHAISFFDFAFVCNDKRWHTEKHSILAFMANTVVQIVTQCVFLFTNYILVSICNLFSQ